MQVTAKHGITNKVVAIIYDFGSNYMAAWRLLAPQLPRLLVTQGCCMHGINLMVKVCAAQ